MACWWNCSCITLFSSIAAGIDACAAGRIREEDARAAEPAPIPAALGCDGPGRDEEAAVVEEEDCLCLLGLSSGRFVFSNFDDVFVIRLVGLLLLLGWREEGAGLSAGVGRGVGQQMTTGSL